MSIRRTDFTAVSTSILLDVGTVLKAWHICLFAYCFCSVCFCLFVCFFFIITRSLNGFTGSCCSIYSFLCNVMFCISLSVLFFFFFDLCIVCPTVHGFRLPFRYLQTFLVLVAILCTSYCSGPMILHNYQYITSYILVVIFFKARQKEPIN